MKNYINICFACFAILIAFSSCNEDDKYFDEKYQKAPISVSQIYLEDTKSSVPDRSVEFARLGQMIRIEGKGLYGMKAVYINGYNTYFNRTYVTDNSMLITINKNTPVAEANSEDRDIIRFVKDNSEYSYNFTIRAASPSVTSVSNTLPQSGETVFVYGTGLEETTKITLPGGNIITEGIESDKDGKWYSFTMPENVTDGGSIYSEGANGEAATPAYFNYSKCMVMNFDGIGAQGSWGSSNKDDNGNIKSGVSMVYPEDLVEDPANTNRGKCLQIVPERLIQEGGISAGKPRAMEFWTAGSDDELNDWSRMYNQGIPQETPVTDVALQFDVYVPEAWSNTGQIQINLTNNFNISGIGSSDDGSKNAVAFYVPWIQNSAIVPFKTTGWQTVTIPFSEFKKFAALIENKEVPTFKDVVDERNNATYSNFGIGFVNTDFTLNDINVVSTVFNSRIYIDNIRVVPCKSIVISDYPDDDE